MAQTPETIKTRKIDIMNPANSIFLGTYTADFSLLLQERFKNCFDKKARRSSCVLINDRYLTDWRDPLQGIHRHRRRKHRCDHWFSQKTALYNRKTGKTY